MIRLFSAIQQCFQFTLHWAFSAIRRIFVPILLFSLTACSLQSEASLHLQFEQNKVDILKILEMQNQDLKVIRIAPTFTRLDTDWSWPRKNIGFSDERWNEYRALFQNAGITDGIEKNGDEIWYFVSSQGLGISGSGRGFVFLKQTPKLIVRKFNECPHNKEVCYIPIEKNWYLYEERN